MHPGAPRVAPVAVLCFFAELLERLAAEGRLRRVYTLRSEFGVNPVYELDSELGPVTVAHPGVGAPLAAAVHRGARRPRGDDLRRVRRRRRAEWRPGSGPRDGRDLRAARRGHEPALRAAEPRHRRRRARRRGPRRHAHRSASPSPSGGPGRPTASSRDAGAAWTGASPRAARWSTWSPRPSSPSRATGPCASPSSSTPETPWPARVGLAPLGPRRARRARAPHFACAAVAAALPPRRRHRPSRLAAWARGSSSRHGQVPSRLRRGARLARLVRRAKTGDLALEAPRGVPVPLRARSSRPPSPRGRSRSSRPCRERPAPTSARRRARPLGRRAARAPGPATQVAAIESLWAFFDRVTAGAPASLRKGPRGGGRDRDAIATTCARPSAPTPRGWARRAAAHAVARAARDDLGGAARRVTRGALAPRVQPAQGRVPRRRPRLGGPGPQRVGTRRT